MLRNLYDKMLTWAVGPKAEAALGAVSFAESSVFPIPPDAMLIPMVLADPRRAWRLAAICTIASVLGGIAGYVIGAALYESLGQWIVATYGLEPKMDEIRKLFAEWGFWFVFAAGITPIPYKAITITSGLVALNPAAFIIASIVSRGLRFALVAGLLKIFGTPIRSFIDRHFALATILGTALLVGGFVLLKYVLA